MGVNISEKFEKFTKHCQNVFDIAASMALATDQAEIGPEHLLYGLVNEQGSISSELLSKTELEAKKLRAWLFEKCGVTTEQGKIKVRRLNYSPAAKQIIKKTVWLAFLHQHQYVGTEHLLASIIQAKYPLVEEIFQSFHINSKSVEEQLILVLKSASKFPDLTDTFEHLKEQHLAEDTAQSNFWEYFAVDLTSASHQKRIDPIFGREAETERLIEILLRRTKNNPLLLGEPGVGKTAIVEGLAKRIFEKKVPDLLLNKKIIALDLSSVVAGAMYRGDFESRLKQIIEEVSQDPNKVLFIDEIHTIIGAGSAMGSLDAANILKPALARGEIRCIGATTFEDYRKYLEKDQALARRFQLIKVSEPDVLRTIEILRGTKSNFEKFHKVEISNEAIDLAVKLADRYLTERFFPDKALDIIDEAAANLKLKAGISPLQKKINEIKSELEKASSAKRAAILAEDFAEAVRLKKIEDKLFGDFEKSKKAVQKTSGKFLGRIAETDVRRVVGKMTGIPINDAPASQNERISHLREMLESRIIGQEEAISTLVQTIKRSQAGLINPEKPLGAFIFLGPSGVGKTETAKALAEAVFEDPKALIRLDMSEYGEKFNVTKLIGAPAGYVGYDEAGLLTEQVRRRPHSVILFDEFEKAHPDVFNLLLQILDTGFLTDAVGRKINFRNTIIILTSNLGSDAVTENQNLGFASGQAKKGIDWEGIKDQMKQSLKDYLRTELLNRFDQTIIFNPLKEAELLKILDIKIEILTQKLANQQKKLELSPEAKKFLIKSKEEPNLGGRIIQRNLSHLVEPALADIILKEPDFAKTIKVNLKKNRLTFE